MVHTRPIILHLVLMLIMKVVTSPPVRFQFLVGQERIPIRVIKYVNLFVRLLTCLAVCPFVYLLAYSFVRSVVRSFLSLMTICTLKFHKGIVCSHGKYFLSLSEIIFFIRMWKVKRNSINKCYIYSKGRF